ncbi:type II toxin-antitoxin system RelE family toxin [Sporosarcina limicola]|uniref:mRNA interferase RelE/StbE n=1 Tax=Sporosarcina limicola TaxID=34101 RepID=A0A927MKI7_9BACL|nr:hypothetical protein [Sporosarcina limicola]MBE1553239.1 mRNA interferase RelE/StbE [Sporosarcina limicola]
MTPPKFDVRLDPDALKEYEKLDGSVIQMVNKSIDELEYRAHEVGKVLENKRNVKLHGCKEIKLQSSGIRIIFRITDEIVEVLRVVYVLAVERRSDDFVFKVASKRFKRFHHTKEFSKTLSDLKKWRHPQKDPD